MLSLFLLSSVALAGIIGYIYISFIIESFDSNVYKNWVFKKRASGKCGMLFSLVVGLFIGPVLWASELYKYFEDVKYFEGVEYFDGEISLIVFIGIIISGSLSGLIYHPIEIYKSKFINK